MSVPFVTANTIAPPLSPADQTRPGPPPGAFDAALAAETNDESMAAAKAEDLVGTRIRAPEGGCGCDALVAASQPAGDTPSNAPLPREPSNIAWTAPLSTATPFGEGAPLSAVAQLSQSPQQIGPRDVEAGDVVLLRDDADPFGRLHQAIARSATEMIAANRSGVVEVLPIPWRRVAGVR